MLRNIHFKNMEESKIMIGEKGPAKATVVVIPGIDTGKFNGTHTDRSIEVL